LKALRSGPILRPAPELVAAVPEPTGRRFWLPLLGTALGLRLLCSLLLIAGWPLVSDGAAYSGQAERMIGDAPGPVGAFYWPPGTSYVLAAAYEVLGSGRVAARLAMIAVSMASVVAVVLLARRVVRDSASVRLAGWIMAVLPSAVFMPSQPFSFDVTLLGVTLTLLGVLVAYDRAQARWLALAGLALGFAALARPGAVSVVAALVPAGVVAGVRLHRRGDRRRLRAIIVGSAAFAVLLVTPLLPAVLHNRAVGAGTTLSTNNEGNLLLGNNPYTPDYKTWDQGQHPLSAFPPAERRWLQAHFTLGGSPDQRAEMRDEALRYMASHPVRTLWRSLSRVRAFWGFDYTYSGGLRNDWDAPLPVVGIAGLLEVGGWFVFGALVLLGWVVGRPVFRSGRLALLLGAVAAYEIPYAIAFSGGRWHLPVLGLLAPVAGAGLASVRSLRAPLTAVRTSPLLAVGLSAFALVQLEYLVFVVAGAR
jgi:4-amino-4-deoxy-L-arabinose transferase-like glycosyltransferase